MNRINPLQLEFLLQLHDLIEHAGKLYGMVRARKLKQQFDRLATPLLDPIAPGQTILLQRIHKNQSLLRFSIFPDHGGCLRISINTRLQPSVDYSWVCDPETRDQLEMDNLLMEYAVLISVNQPHGEKRRFIEFCLTAHLQVEAILKYFFNKKGHQPISPNKTHPDHYSRIWEFFKLFNPWKTNPDKPDMDNLHYRNVDALRVLRNIEFHRSKLPATPEETINAKEAFQVWRRTKIKQDQFDLINQGIYLDLVENGSFKTIRETLQYVTKNVRNYLSC
ncbi:hypothetical protein [Rhodocaloribacter sp.]